MYIASNKGGKRNTTYKKSARRFNAHKIRRTMRAREGPLKLENSMGHRYCVECANCPYKQKFFRIETARLAMQQHIRRPLCFKPDLQIVSLVPIKERGLGNADRPLRTDIPQGNQNLLPGYI